MFLLRDPVAGYLSKMLCIFVGRVAANGLFSPLNDEAGFTAKHQAERVMEAFDALFKVWTPRENFEIVNATDYKGKFLNHKIVY